MGRRDCRVSRRTPRAALAARRCSAARWMPCRTRFRGFVTPTSADCFNRQDTARAAAVRNHRFYAIVGGHGRDYRQVLDRNRGGCSKRLMAYE
jgi:hypothetical protein